MMMDVKCPYCGSFQIIPRNIGHKVGCVVGTAAGATGIFAGAEIGGTAGLAAGPVGAIIGGYWVLWQAALLGHLLAMRPTSTSSTILNV